MTVFVAEWCPESKGPSGGYDIQLLIGTRLIINLMLTLLQAVSTVYVLVQTHQTQLANNLKWCLRIYHVFVAIQLIGGSVYDFYPCITGEGLDNVWSCLVIFTSRTLTAIPYVAYILFWNFRLNTVFESSIYKVSKGFNIFVYVWATLGLIATWIFGLFAFFEAFTGSLPPNEAFCVLSVKVLDFVPYSSRSWTNIKGFKKCELYKAANVNVNRLSIFVGAVSMPFLTVVISVQYIRKMLALYRFMKYAADSNDSQGRAYDKREIKRRQHVYRNSVVAVCSGVGTLLALAAYAFTNDVNWTILVGFDYYMNGLLMISVTHFGRWVFDLLCIKSCVNCGVLCRCCKKMEMYQYHMDMIVQKHGSQSQSNTTQVQSKQPVPSNTSGVYSGK